MIQPNSVWPPPELACVTEKTAESQVWWEGSTEGLNDFYSVDRPSATRPTFRSRGRDAFNAFWGRKALPTAQPLKRVHVPLAGDITKLSASALFSEPLTIVDPTGASQDLIDSVFNTPLFHSALFGAGESCSALGGNYQRIVWDGELSARPWIDFVDADKAIPEFRWGRLVAVTFWSELPSEDSSIVWRHLERHEIGRIRHQLYCGSARNLGRLEPLAAHSHTSGLTVEDGDSILTGITTLTASYVPNVLPNPEWRHDPNLKYLGRSDLSSDVIPLFHSLDEIESSLMRDFRLAKARMFASRELLTSLGGGEGMMLPEDQEVFTQVGMGTDSEGNPSPMFEFHQPDIRVEAHSAGAEKVVREILRRVGYSPLSFGMQDEVAQTATEATGKQKMTVTTTLGKSRHWGAALGPLATTLVALNSTLFGDGPMPEKEFSVEWPPFARDSDLVRATTVQAWNAAGAASTRRKVSYLNPDQDEQWIDEEVAAIDGIPVEETPDETIPTPPVEESDAPPASESNPEDIETPLV